MIIMMIRKNVNPARLIVKTKLSTKIVNTIKSIDDNIKCKEDLKQKFKDKLSRYNLLTYHKKETI